MLCRPGTYYAAAYVTSNMDAPVALTCDVLALQLTAARPPPTAFVTLRPALAKVLPVAQEALAARRVLAAGVLLVDTFRGASFRLAHAVHALHIKAPVSFTCV